MTHDRIADAFAKPYPLVIPYITIGDPDLATTRQSVITLAKAGAGMIELGLPFSDPIADGPTIQRSTERALKNKFGLTDVFAMTKALRDEEKIETPFVLMSYANPIFNYGFEKFCRDAVANGIDAVIITDMPPEVSEEYLGHAKENGLGTIFLCSPTTSPERLQLIDQSSTAFVYYASRTGVTGASAELPEGLGSRVRQVRNSLQHNKLCVGFGISREAHMHHLASHVDGLIVGSAIIELFERHKETALQSVLGLFTANLVEAASHHRKFPSPIKIPVEI